MEIICSARSHRSEARPGLAAMGAAMAGLSVRLVRRVAGTTENRLMLPTGGSGAHTHPIFMLRDERSSWGLVPN